MRWIVLPLLLVPGTALPCGEEEAVVQFPPAQAPEPTLRILGHRVRREFRPVAGEGMLGGTSCAVDPSDRGGRITLSVEFPGGSPSSRWEVEIVRGSTRLFSLSREPIDEPILFLRSGLDDDEPIDVDVRVVAVDLEGRRSPPSPPHRIRDDGMGMGCSATGEAAGLLPVVAALLLLLARVRTRGRAGEAWPP